MTTLEQFFSPALTRALGWTLLHSLWQGALVAAVLAGALLLLRRQRAEVRYVASAGALGVVVALAGITFGLYFNSAPVQGVLLSPGTVKTLSAMPTKQIEASATGVSVAARVGVSVVAEETGKSLATAGHAAHLRQLSGVATSPVAPAATPDWLATGLRYFDNHLPLLVVAWLLGLLAMSLRMLGGLLYVQRLRRYRVRPLPAAWQERLAALAARSGVNRPVALLESALVRVPLVVGHLRPVILLPLGTVAGLSPAYLEAILAHELAHVLRRDYLVNLLQTLAETVFFYHPAVWFVAGCVRTERENCCDDTATALVGGDPLRLARALTALAEWSQSAVVPNAPRLALAAMNRPGALLLRVRRLVQRRPAAPTLAEGLMASALVLGGLGLLGGSVALAGPLAGSSPAAPLSAFDWQTGTIPSAKAAGVADTNKRAARVAPVAPGAPGVPAAPIAPEAAVAPVPPAPPADELREVVVERRDGDEQAGNDPRDGRPDRHRERRVINGREMNPSAFQSNPGTVVITKDKKGRLTDLVVNGQHVETATGKSKKSKSGKGQQVEVVQVSPFGGADMRSFAFRTDGGELDQQIRREVEHNVQRNIERNVERNINRDMQRNRDFQFNFPDFGEQFDKSLRMEPDTRLYRLRSLNGNADPENRRAELEGLRGAERGLRKAAAAKGLTATQRKEINKELEKVRGQIKRAELAASSRPRQFGGADARLNKLDAEMSERDEELRERSADMQDRQREMQDRRRELQERIRESQRELRDMEQDRGQADRDRAQAERDRAQAMRDQAQANQDRGQAMRDQAQANQDRAQAERDRRQAERDRTQAERDRKRAERDEALIDQLQKDGLIQNKDNFQLRLTPNGLTVNGKEQSAKLRDKYLKLHAEAGGHALSGNDVMVITRNGDSSFNYNTDRSEGPRPPRLPRVPRTPGGPLTPLIAPAPPTPPMLNLPAPPRPPRINADELRRELRKDGVLAADDKNLQFQLNGSGLTVNGKKQSDELAAKYRKLTGHTDGKNFNVMISTQED